MDASSGKILQRFDLTQAKDVEQLASCSARSGLGQSHTSFPDTVIASHDGRRAWCSLLMPPKKIAASSHPTALLLSPDESRLYVILSNRDAVAVISTADGKVERYLDACLPGQTYGGSYPKALAQSNEGKTLYVANASSDAVAVFQIGTQTVYRAGYFVPTEWYPTAVAIHDGELLIAAGKGQSTGPNAGWEADEIHPDKREHPYIASMIRGSIARVNTTEAARDGAKLTQQVIRSNQMEGRTGEIPFPRGEIPFATLSTSSRKTAPMTRSLETFAKPMVILRW